MRNVIVTGASRGLGLAIASILAGSGSLTGGARTSRMGARRPTASSGPPTIMQ